MVTTGTCNNSGGISLEELNASGDALNEDNSSSRRGIDVSKIHSARTIEFNKKVLGKLGNDFMEVFIGVD